jgi:MFS family permease
MMAASYPLGAICSTPFSAPIADMFGRRWAILIGMNGCSNAKENDANILPN